MVSPAGVLTWGNTDFPMSEGYAPYASIDPPRYDASTPNRWCADGVAVLDHGGAGRAMLIGALGCAKQFCQVYVDLSSDPPKITACTHGDGVLLKPGARLRSEEIVVSVGKGWPLLRRYARLFADGMNARAVGDCPRVWCSWNEFFDRVDQDDVIRVADFLAEHRDDMPVEYLQVDDGYERHVGDWFDTTDRFPDGLDGLAKAIRRRGFKPGLWVAPFWVERDSRLYKEHPDWILGNSVGRDVFLPMFHKRDVATLDCTKSEVRKWLFELFERFCRVGFEFFKLDFIVWEALHGSDYHDNSTTRCQAYRMGLTTIREAIGDRLLLSGTGIMAASVGLADLARVGADTYHLWWSTDGAKTHREASSFLNIHRNIAARSYANKVWWISDPDAPMIRQGACKRGDVNELTADEIKLTLAGQLLCGGAVMLGEDLSRLPAERLDWIKRLFENKYTTFEPLDLFEREVPRIWWQRPNEDGPGLLGLFNWTEEGVSLSVKVADLGISARTVQLADFWNPQRTMTADDTVVAENIPPHSCQLYVVTNTHKSHG